MANKTFDMSEFEIERFIETYFSDNNVKKEVSSWSYRSEMCGIGGQKFFEAVEFRAQTGDFSNTLYPHKNVNERVSALACSVFDRERMTKFAKNIFRMFPSLMDGRFLELGCDNGMLLCLLAKRYPNVKFVGIDACAEGIALANARARNLGLSNVTFIHSPIKDFLAKQKDQSFGIVLSMLVWHEVLNVYQPKNIKRKDLLIFKEIKRVMAKGGAFITMDRVENTESKNWVTTIAQQGLAYQQDFSFAISYSTPQTQWVFPVFFFENDEPTVKPAQIEIEIPVV